MLVTNYNTIWYILTLGVVLDIKIHQMEMKTVFLNSKLEKEIYMEQMQGFVQKGSKHLVCKLKKSLYGVKQSPRARYQH